MKGHYIYLRKPKKRGTYAPKTQDVSTSFQEKGIRPFSPSYGDIHSIQNDFDVTREFLRYPKTGNLKSLVVNGPLPIVSVQMDQWGNEIPEEPKFFSESDELRVRDKLKSAFEKSCIYFNGESKITIVDMDVECFEYYLVHNKPKLTTDINHLLKTNKMRISSPFEPNELQDSLFLKRNKNSSNRGLSKPLFNEWTQQMDTPFAGGRLYSRSNTESEVGGLYRKDIFGYSHPVSFHGFLYGSYFHIKTKATKTFHGRLLFWNSKTSYLYYSNTFKLPKDGPGKKIKFAEYLEDNSTGVTRRYLFTYFKIPPEQIDIFDNMTLAIIEDVTITITYAMLELNGLNIVNSVLDGFINQYENKHLLSPDTPLDMHAMKHVRCTKAVTYHANPSSPARKVLVTAAQDIAQWWSSKYGRPWPGWPDDPDSRGFCEFYAAWAIRRGSNLAIKFKNKWIKYVHYLEDFPPPKYFERFGYPDLSKFFLNVDDAWKFGPYFKGHRWISPFDYSYYLLPILIWSGFYTSLKSEGNYHSGIFINWVNEFDPTAPFNDFYLLGASQPDIVDIRIAAVFLDKAYYINRGDKAGIFWPAETGRPDVDKERGFGITFDYVPSAAGLRKKTLNTNTLRKPSTVHTKKGFFGI